MRLSLNLLTSARNSSGSVVGRSVNITSIQLLYLLGSVKLRIGDNSSVDVGNCMAAKTIPLISKCSSIPRFALGAGSTIEHEQAAWEQSLMLRNACSSWSGLCPHQRCVHLGQLLIKEVIEVYLTQPSSSSFATRRTTQIIHKFTQLLFGLVLSSTLL